MTERRSYVMKEAKASDSILDKIPDSDLVAIIDLDYAKYTVASAGEKRTLKVTHKETGKEILNPKVEDGKKVKVPFNTRTEFWGRGKKRDGGYLGEVNKLKEKKGQPLATWEDFEIEDIQTTSPLDHVLHSAKVMVERDLASLGTKNYEAILGKGASFREGLSTLQKYKGGRDNLLKAVYLDDVTNYLAEKFKAKWVEGIEADDAVVMRAYGDPNAVVLGEDKDYRGQPIKYFDINNPDEGIIDGDCFGELWEKSKTKISGKGRLFLYFQMLAGDSSDDYKASLLSDINYGDKSAYKALKDCKDDQEALRAVVSEFKRMYPEPITIETWQGVETTVDWYYVANEMFQMARMLRWNGDLMSFSHWLMEYNVDIKGL